jgi:hypothetical protein
MGIFENLTDKQWELLEVLVSGHKLHGGAEFSFSCNFGGCGVTYPGGIFDRGAYHQTDLIQLGTEHLVTTGYPSHCMSIRSLGSVIKSGWRWGLKARLRRTWQAVSALWLSLLKT